MQVWRAPVRRCLFCVYRPAAWKASRPFSLSAPLERSKPKQRIKQGAQPATGSPWQKQRDKRVEVAHSPNFLQLLEAAIRDLESQLTDDEVTQTQLDEFRQWVADAFSNETPRSRLETKRMQQLKETLQHQYIETGHRKLPDIVQEEFHNFKRDTDFSSSVRVQQRMADYRYPTEWYPAARAIQRRIHLHVGPTNSGKTYHALKRLEEAKTGFYGGPLRLLAHEVYTRLNAKGIACGLITGDEVKVDEENPTAIYSNTVEMVPLGKDMEVGVIDEIQMLADPSRGWAWTRAFLGAQVQELHVCGEERVVPLVRELAASMGDELEIHHYKRLNPLKPMKTSLKGNLERLEKGDCIVAFSRLAIHALKQAIEKTTGRRAAIVYGSLPPEIRSQQADLFNDPDNDYDFLVASDAIGMGLNLSVKRIIFESVVRRKPSGLERLSVSQVKQIGGRAGRYRVAMQSSPSDDEDENVGFVTSLEDIDLPYIRQALNAEPEPIHAAGILPHDYMVQNFASHFPPNTPFTYIMDRLATLAMTHPRYFLCPTSGEHNIGKILDGIRWLSPMDKLVFFKAPTDTRNEEAASVVEAYARAVAENTGGSLLDIPELRLDVLDQPVSGDKDYLRSLETLHRSLVLYLWLSFRVGGIFTDRTLATHVKELTEMKMDRALTEFSANSSLQKASSLRRQIALLRQMQTNQEAEPSNSSQPPGDEDSNDLAELQELQELEDLDTTEQSDKKVASPVTG